MVLLLASLYTCGTYAPIWANEITETTMSTKQKEAVKDEKKRISVDYPENSYRLPRNVLPDNYSISLSPDLEKKTFTGKEQIDIAVSEPTDKIVINAAELKIPAIYVTNSKGDKLEAKVSYDDEKEFAIFTFDKPLSVGQWQLHCEFSGILNDKLKGFYCSTWTDSNDKKHTMAVTQFEATDARRAFPCFDEPDFKATYNVTLIVPQNLAAISNGRIVNETVDTKLGKKTVVFKKTMKMSTYLLAFLVGDFESSEPVNVNGMELRAWTVPGKKNLTDFALRVAAYTIDYFEKYFRVPYPAADKCDLIAVPDFAAGAMENKDCITFRETALLVDEKTATQGELERVAEVVMHELAHMWFGDLVTMRWWNGLWLNEAFATFMEMKALNTYKPDWKVWDKFGMSRAAAARTDALKSTHPIECPVSTPDQARELFDVISYQKGCSVLYQIEQFIGEETFRNGITAYLNKHAFANTETYDLWDALEQSCVASGVNTPVRKIMDDWVFNGGHPLVQVSEGKEPGTIELSQKPFMFLPDQANDKTYLIPITMRVKSTDGQIKSTDTQKFLLDEKTKTVSVGNNFRYVVINAGGSGFYRVNYSPALANKLLADAQNNLTVIERFNLVNDSWAAVRAGYLSAADYLETIKLFKNESDYSVWQIILSSLGALRRLTKDQAREDFKKFVFNLCENKANELGWKAKDNESVQTKQLRGSLIDALGTTAEDKHTYDEAAKAFQSWQKEKTSIDNNILPAVVSTLAYHGDNERYEQFQELYKESKTPQEQLRFLYSLAGFRNEKLLDKTMDSCLSEEIKTQDAPYVFASVANNEIATSSAWPFLQKHWQKMVDRFPDTGVVRMCASVIPVLDTPTLETEAEQFFAEHKVKEGEMAISQALESLRINLLMRERETKNLAEYLKK
jgi:puromycin-sensitive aminopeptidase